MGPHARNSLGWTAALTAAVAAGWVTGRRLDRAAEALPDPGREDAAAFDWIAFFKELYGRIGDHRITAIAAGVTYFVILALFPAIAALVSVYGLFANVEVLGHQLDTMAGILPQSAIDIVGAELARVISQQNAALGVAFLVSLTVSLWSANAGMKALFDALNIIHDESEKRGFVALNGLSLLFTAGLIMFFIVAVAAIVVLPVTLSGLGVADGLEERLVQIGRWPVLFAAIALVLSLVYRFGPSCNEARWRVITWGSATAAFAWIVASMLFSSYAANFANFNKTYGTLGAVIGFMTWNWIVTIVILVGAEIDAILGRRPGTPLGQPRKAG
jgi:membrane protein